ncbi:MAG: lipoyl(octanoyl) transferase LipB [Trueperaceae bacterium]
MNEPFEVRDLGTLDYKAAWEVQFETHRAVVEGRQPPTLLLVEHPPVITFGRKGGRENLRVTEDFLKEKGFALYDIERGGDITYHGPGQLVGYPIFRVGRSARAFLRKIEESLVNMLVGYGLETQGSPGYAGVLFGEGLKIASIGVAIKRDVSFHGFALNVSTNLNHFNYIVPCGLTDKTMTSMTQQLGREIYLDEVKPNVVKAFEDVFVGDATLVSEKGLSDQPLAISRQLKDEKLIAEKSL